MRVYTRLSNGFSRKIENHMAAVAVNYFAYNFIKIRLTLRVSPAMAAGVTNRLFDVSDLVADRIRVEKGGLAAVAGMLLCADAGRDSSRSNLSVELSMVWRAATVRLYG
jgi:hypothetical protein